jgi:hypothetical protein
MSLDRELRVLLTIRDQTSHVTHGSRRRFEVFIKNDPTDVAQLLLGESMYCVHR